MILRHYAGHLCFLLAISPFAFAASQPIEEIIISADFGDASILQVPASVSVMGSDTIEKRNAQHLETILNGAPNVNFSSGASRGRFIQIRGIGERSQFVDPVNPSVGLMVDNIDFSGIGNAGTLFDVQQAEVLRGPQGTRYGNNALAGMVNIQSRDPGQAFEGRVEAGTGNYDSATLGAVVSGPLSESLLGRLAVQQHRSDGFTRNDFVDREDTGNFDELTLRGKLKWLASDELTLDTTVFHVNVDNGYDAFSLDNRRHTLSDEPGHDRQESSGFALHGLWTGFDAAALESTLTYSNSNLEYGYDEDWVFVGFDPAEYSSTDNYIRDRENASIDLRLVSEQAGALLGGSTDWVVGLYYETQDEDLHRENTFLASDFHSRSAIDTRSVYGQLSSRLSDSWVLNLGARYENFANDYRDNVGVKADPRNDLWGGEISLEYLFDDNTLLYGLISRSAKGGGVNGSAVGETMLNPGLDPATVAFLQQRTEFGDESLVNYEIGLKGSYFDDRLQTRLSLFRMARRNMQLKAWIADGAQFIDYIDNVSAGESYGLELETQWQAAANLALFASVGWLETSIEDDFRVNDPLLGLVNKKGREVAHAPNYQFNLGGQLDFAEYFYARLEVEGKDGFFFSNSHDDKSSAYELVNATLGFSQNNVQITFWARNLLNKGYHTRGFLFGNDPRTGYTPAPYYQFGEPRTVGVTGRYSF